MLEGCVCSTSVALVMNLNIGTGPSDRFDQVQNAYDDNGDDQQ